MNQSTSFFLLLILLVQCLHPKPIAAQEPEEEREFDYVKDSGFGPENWGELKEEWAACKQGKMQSPIDLLNENVEVVHAMNKGEVKLRYKPGNATVKNRGHDISIQWELGDAGFMEINGTQYMLQQCHWHSPSEHTIQGNRSNMELHMVHINSDANVENNIVVVAYLYTLGGPDEFLAKISPNIQTMIDVHEEKKYGMVDPRDMKQDGCEFYKYMGSLTVPPCTEGVTWIVHKKLATVSKEQMELLREAVHDSAELNARPLQNLNNRNVHFHADMCTSLSAANPT